ncbi:MAG: Uma2 family endonuclease [Pseudanabaena sp. M57BS1SP1A06MG]|nr:Uma2 family endonuclease [Pseudanabaena sp. M53BS1SP1A06MG]MCA6583289.1 Uma2 family endonuclease [Pseudanabaena sp. M34BS1SP1A06MG]MCA6591063.1 Uma2 family endonuclease [Pseudanabaena sp. M38BS1SP1A06MG]MCA6601121.1 Uma2 family endonuclease [Pseudanabaena sp. M57BS1SP1A06MG]
MTVAIRSAKINDTNCTIQGVSWLQFESIEAAFSSVEGVRFVYLDGVLEIMTLSPEHEEIKSTIGLLLEVYLRHSGIRFYKRGSATLGSRDLGGRKEPDESYNFNLKKDIPDLIIEVVLTSGYINSLDLYARMGIAEVWYWEDGKLKVYDLEEQVYKNVKASRFFPNLNLNILAKYITYYDQYEAIADFIKELQ